MKIAWLFVWLTLPLLIVVPVYRGLDAQGCHHDRKNGGYHCHRAQSTDTEASSQTKSRGIEGKTSSPQAPVTYIGPRGGRYHYSASGRKVYERRK